MKKQCKKCPWRADADPYEIRGYSAERHRRLARTIATPDTTPTTAGVRLMACHESPRGRDQACAGWLHNQLGVGNNVALRLAARLGDFDASHEIDGPQKASFEETLPREK